jgi:hypothetical protein
MRFDAQNKSPGNRAGASGKRFGGQQFHVQNASAEPLLQRLDGVQKSGTGWRAKCPACGGHSRKVSITEVVGKVLLHCFGGCEAVDVLTAVGLTWADVMPPRHWPASPDERRRARRAIREVGWSSALSQLAYAAKVILFAGQKFKRWQPLDEADDVTLSQAVAIVDGAANIFVEAAACRPSA